jgi:two-component system sensor histidine kinase KdpD
MAFLLAILGVAAMTVLIAIIPGADHTTNVSLLYLLVVMGAAHWLGRNPAVLASLLAVLSFDWFFVEPRHTVTVNDPAEWLALVVFLVTAMVISQLTTLVRQRAAVDAHAQALAEGDRLKTALLSMVSHDFRSPLAAIKASVTGLLQGDAPWDASTQRELLIGINEETDRLNRMVGNILALSRLEAGAWRPQREVIAISELLGAALDTFSDDENKRIRVEIQTEAHDVSVDSVQIVQVLHNLLENALKYSEAASVVELCVTQREEILQIEVLDQGYGIPFGEEERIFERFYRASRWQESSQPGSGIGLAICRGLVEAHGGQLTARNREGGGAIFTVCLPMN